MTTKQILRQIPANANTHEVLSFIHNRKFNARYFSYIKALTNLSDEKISNFLNISVKTYRNYQTSNFDLGKGKQEHAIMILGLIKHGIEVFGSGHNFTEWLEKENFYFDNKPPINYLNYMNGIKFIDDSLIGMEYGDNA